MCDISILTMVYKPTHNWGAPPCNYGKSPPLMGKSILQKSFRNVPFPIAMLNING